MVIGILFGAACFVLVALCACDKKQSSTLKGLLDVYHNIGYAIHLDGRYISNPNTHQLSEYRLSGVNKDDKIIHLRRK